MAKILQILDKIAQTYHLSLNPIGRNPEVPQIIPRPEEKFIWPQSKPFQEIVFPQLIKEETTYRASLWLMLPQSEIETYAYTTRYTRFIFITHPHPMLLWITLLYDQDLTPKWLPCYLDMKNAQNLKLVWTLAETESYSLLFFSLNPPHHCTNKFSIMIAPPQTQNLKSWIQQSQNITPSGQSTISKNWLKEQYKQIQEKIINHLQT
ncbi:MAG: hypothetical protein ACKO3K_11745 [Cuspidothrix sp.]